MKIHTVSSFAAWLARWDRIATWLALRLHRNGMSGTKAYVTAERMTAKLMERVKWEDSSCS